jgi:hypothetical protein
MNNGSSLLRAQQRANENYFYTLQRIEPIFRDRLHLQNPSFAQRPLRIGGGFRYGIAMPQNK